MKKFMKVCGIIVGILLALAILLIVAGAIGGAAFPGRAQLRGIFSERGISFGRGDGGAQEHFWWNEDWDTYDPDEGSVLDDSHEVIRDAEGYDVSFGAEEITALNVELGGCMLVVTVSPDEDFHVHAGNINAFQAYADEKTLEVRGIRKGSWSGFHVGADMYVEIQVPEGAVFTDVKFELGAGEFIANDLICDRAEFDVGAGHLKINGLTAGTLVCELGAGVVELEAITLSGDASLEVGMGELRYQGSAPGNLAAEVGMGDMRILVTGSAETDHNYDLQCAAGNLTAGGHTIAGLASQQNIDNGAESTYKLSCSMGNLTLLFEE